MNSPTAIANTALSYLGEDGYVTNFNPPEGGPYAEYCARFYTTALETLLEMHPWSFATARQAGALLTSETTSWEYAYAVPNDSLRVISVLPPDSPDDYSGSVAQPTSPYQNTYSRNFSYYPSYQPQPFATELLADATPVIYTNQPNAIIRYTRRVTDVTKMPMMFKMALARLLASMLAGPIIKGDVGRKEGKGHYEMFMLEFAKAASSDGEQQDIELTHIVPWLAGRY